LEVKSEMALTDGGILGAAEVQISEPAVSRAEMLADELRSMDGAGGEALSRVHI
jgi:hypothetical protein